jgi:hypothetical protein
MIGLARAERQGPWPHAQPVGARARHGVAGTPAVHGASRTIQAWEISPIRPGAVPRRCRGHHDNENDETYHLIRIGVSISCIGEQSAMPLGGKNEASTVCCSYLFRKYRRRESQDRGRTGKTETWRRGRCPARAAKATRHDGALKRLAFIAGATGAPAGLILALIISLTATVTIAEVPQARVAIPI